MNTVDEPDNQIDPEDYEDDGDLWIDEGIVLPPNSPYRRVSSMASQDSVHRTEYDFDGLDDEIPEFLNFKDPLDDGDW